MPGFVKYVFLLKTIHTQLWKSWIIDIHTIEIGPRVKCFQTCTIFTSSINLTKYTLNIEISSCIITCFISAVCFADFKMQITCFLFAIFQVRSQMPGNPPSGVKFDMLIFFPVILLLICLIMVNVSQWNKREDWDMENHIIAIHGHRTDAGIDTWDQNSNLIRIDLIRLRA